PATKSTAIVSWRLPVSKSTLCTYHGALIPRAASNSWFVIIRLVLHGWLQHSAATSHELSLSNQCASRVRCAGLTPALDPPNHPLRIQKRLFLFMDSANQRRLAHDAISARGARTSCVP